MVDEVMENQWKKPFMLLNCIIFVIGVPGIPLVTRLYFVDGGSNAWLSTWVSTSAFPIILIPLLVSYINRRFNAKDSGTTKLVLMQPWLFMHCAFLGIFYGILCFLYNYGSSKLPVSTSTLIISSQLVFISGFAFILVKQEFSKYSISAIVLLTVGDAVLALNASNDLPEGESIWEYVMGFIAVLANAILLGVYMPLVEWTITNAKQVVTYTLMLEINIVICFSATAFSTVGMLIHQDFQTIPEEAGGFEYGEVAYYVVLVSLALVNQCYIIGANGVIFCFSSLFYAVSNATLLSVAEIMGLVLYQEKLHVEKIVSLLLSLLGFASYFYGELRQNKLQDQTSDTDHPPLLQHV